MLLVLAAATAAVSPAPLSLCVGRDLNSCVQAIKAQYRVDDDDVSSSVFQLQKVDVNGRPLNPYRRVIFDAHKGSEVISPSVSLTLSKSGIVTEAGIDVSPMIAHARTEGDFDATDLERAMGAFFDAKCWNNDKKTLYRWFTNSLKAAVVRDPKERRLDFSAAEESQYSHSRRVAFCGRHVSYSGLSGNSTDSIDEGNSSGGFALASIVVSP